MSSAAVWFEDDGVHVADDTCSDRGMRNWIAEWW